MKDREQVLGMTTPAGRLIVAEVTGCIARITWDEDAPADDETPLLKRAQSQIEEYFRRERRSFDLPLKVQASPAQQRACAAMSEIPFGETVTYGELARTLGISAQAAGQLCGGNPIPLVIPCHRVLGATSLGGFSGGMGVETKVALLKHEGAASLLI